MTFKSGAGLAGQPPPTILLGGVGNSELIFAGHHANCNGMKTWEEIQKLYPNEHVAIVNPKCPPEYPAKIEEGDVLDHDPELDTLLSRCDLSPYDKTAVLYTGDLGALIGERGMIRVIEND